MESGPESPGEVGNGVLSALHEKEAIPNKRSSSKEAKRSSTRSTRKSCSCHKRFQRKLMLQSWECEYYRSQRPTVGLAVVVP